MNLHPGHIVRTELIEPLGLTPKHLCRLNHAIAPDMANFLNEKGRITPAIAGILASVTGISEQFFLNLQAQYDKREVT